MDLRNTTESYGLIARLLHWMIALLIIIMICVGLSFDYLPKGPIFNLAMFMHKSTGVTILILMIIRIFWRLTNPVPTLPAHMKHWEIVVAKLTHFLLYALVLIMPITGILLSLAAGHNVPFWGLSTIPASLITKNLELSHLMKESHEILAWAIASLTVIHTAGALKHQFIYKDNVMKRM